MAGAEREGAKPGPTIDTSATFIPPFGFTQETLAEAREKKALGGQIIVVFGASPTGIGGAVAYEVALQGANVVTVSRNKVDNSEAEKFAASLTKENGAQAKWIPADITEKDAGARVIKDVAKDFGKVDGVVIASGIRDNYPFIGMSYEKLMRVLDADLIGPFFTIQAAFIQMLRQTPPYGRVVVIGSEASKGSPGQSNYAVSKGGLVSLIPTVALEIEVMHKRRHPELDISVVNVSPGVVRTGLTADLKPGQKALLRTWTGADRDMQPSEVAVLVAYALSQEGGANLSGQSVPIVGKGPVF